MGQCLNEGATLCIVVTVRILTTVLHAVAPQSQSDRIHNRPIERELPRRFGFLGGMPPSALSTDRVSACPFVLDCCFVSCLELDERTP